MKKKLELSTTITTTLLLLILASVKIPFLIFTAFTLLIARSVKMYLNSISESYEVNEEQPASNFSKLLAVRLVTQFIPIILMALVLYIFFLRKEIWLTSFK